MVKAILDGRKTQTRRVCKPMNAWVEQECREVRQIDGVPYHFFVGAQDPIERLRSRFGQTGDRLWVRETWQGPLLSEDQYQEYRDGRRDAYQKPDFCRYAADGGAPPEFVNDDDNLVCRWRPSIHMPRWASRILLEVTNVRVERLSDCSEEDAEVEGVNFLREVPDADETLTAKQLYACLWDSINGNGAWDANPWVWVVSFKRVTA
jgi:hypothetical protein